MSGGANKRREVRKFKGDDWWAVAINMRDKVIQYMDSIRDGARGKIACGQAMTWIQHEYRRRHDGQQLPGAWRWETKATRQQIGYVDCGVHLCVNLRAVAEAAPSTPWTEGDPVRLRHGVVTELHNKRLWGYTEAHSLAKDCPPEPAIETSVGSAGNRTRDLLHPKQESYH